MASVPLIFEIADARRVARETYGLDAQVDELPAYVDRNFRLRTARGSFVLKISRSDESDEDLDLQIQALIHLLDKGVTVPRPYPSIHGELLSHVQAAEGGRVRARLLSWMEGCPFADVEQPTPGLLRDAGDFLARLDQALASFSHPAAERVLPWDLRHALSVRELIGLVPEAARRRRVEGCLDRFEKLVATPLDTLPRGVIHNDANDYNVLVTLRPTARVSAVIDFGDMVHTARVCDPAIFLAYAMLGHDDPFPAARAFLEGYHARLPLSAAESELLPDLVAMRLVVSVLSSTKAKLTRPGDPYLDVTEPKAWKLLEFLDSFSSEELKQRMLVR